MSDDPLSDAFARIEDLLRDGSAGEPPLALRASVMRAVNERLVAGPPMVAEKSNGWGFLIGVAAMLLIGANLAVIGSADTRFAPSARLDPVQARSAARLLQQAAPELSSDEAQRMVVLVACARHLSPLPQVEPAIDLPPLDVTLRIDRGDTPRLPGVSP